MSNLKIKHRLLISFFSLILFFGLNLASYFWGKGQKDHQLNNLNTATDAQVTSLTLQKMISDLKKQVGLVQEMTQAAGDNEIVPMAKEEVSIFSSQVKAITEKVSHLVDVYKGDELGKNFQNSYDQLQESWLKFYTLYGGPEHKKAMLTLIIEAEPAAENSLTLIDQLIKNTDAQVTQAKSEFDKISILVNQISIGLFVASIIFAVFISLAVASYIAKRLSALQDGANYLKDGHLDARVNIKGNDELADLGTSFNSMAESLLKAREEIVSLQREMEQIFDTIGLSIMTFDEDLIVNDLYSKETDNILPGSNPAGRSIYDVIFENSDISVNQKSALESEILMSFDSDQTQWELTDLETPKEFRKAVNSDERDFKVNFRPIFNSDDCVSRVLCQIEDITSIKALQAEAQKQSEKVEKIRLITHLGSTQFPHFAKEQQGYILRLQNFIKMSDNDVIQEKEVAPLKRALHTGKGNSNLLGAVDLANIYHETENCLKAYIASDKENKDQTLENLKNIAKTLTQFIDDYNDVFQEVYGDDNYAGTIGARRLAWAEDILHSFASLPNLPEETRGQINSFIKQFHLSQDMQPADNLVRNYQVHVDRVTRKVGTEIDHVKFHGFEKLLVSPEITDSINEALVHTVTNAVVHGYKKEFIHLLDNPKIKVDITASVDNDGLNFEISDRGCGIDTEKLKSKAIELNPEKEDMINKFSSHELLQLVFTPNISTYENVNLFAGNGIGMYAAAQALEGIGGKVTVQSEWKHGTRVSLWLPKEHNGQTNFVMVEPPLRQHLAA